MIHVVFLLLLFCISTNIIGCMDDFMDLTQDVLNTQRQKEPYGSWKWNSISFNETNPLQGLDLLQAQEITDNLWKCPTLPEKPSNSSDIFAEISCTTDRSPNSQPQPDTGNLSISSSSRRQYSLPTASENISENILESKNIDALQQISSLSRQQIQEPFTENLETMSQQPTLKTLSLRFLEDAQSIKLGKTKSLIPSGDENSTVFDQEFDDQEAPIPKKPPRKKRKLYLSDSTCFTIICTRCPNQQPFQTQSYCQF